MKRYPHLVSRITRGDTNRALFLADLNIHVGGHALLSIDCWSGGDVEGKTYLFADTDPRTIVARFLLADAHAALEQVLGPLHFRAKEQLCATCRGTGSVCVGYSGMEVDGNAPEFERCPECGYGDEPEPEEAPDMRPPREGESLCLSPGDDL